MTLEWKKISSFEVSLQDIKNLTDTESATKGMFTKDETMAKRKTQKPKNNRKLIQLDFELEEKFAKKKKDDAEMYYKKQAEQTVYNKKMLIVDYGFNKEKDESIEFGPFKEKGRKKIAVERTSQPLPTLKPRSQTPKKKKSTSKSVSKNKKSFTPIVDQVSPSRVAIPAIKDNSFYHNLCKRPVDKLKGRSDNELNNTSPSRRMVKSRSVPKLKGTFYDKKVEFYVKMANKIENGTYKPSTNNITPERMYHNNQKVQGLKDTMSKYNKEVQTSKYPAVEPKKQILSKLPDLTDDQFCKFCDNYFHEKCFDDFYKHTH